MKLEYIQNKYFTNHTHSQLTLTNNNWTTINQKVNKHHSRYFNNHTRNYFYSHTTITNLQQNTFNDLHRNNNTHSNLYFNTHAITPRIYFMNSLHHLTIEPLMLIPKHWQRNNYWHSINTDTININYRPITIQPTYLTSNLYTQKNKRLITYHLHTHKKLTTDP